MFGPPFGPLCTGMPAGFSITSINPSRWSTRARISSSVGWLISISPVKGFVRGMKRLTPPHERYHLRNTEAELVAQAVGRAEAHLGRAGHGGGRSRHQTQARPPHGR